MYRRGCWWFISYLMSWCYLCFGFQTCTHPEIQMQLLHETTKNLLNNGTQNLSGWRWNFWKIFHLQLQFFVSVISLPPDSSSDGYVSQGRLLWRAQHLDRYLYTCFYFYTMCGHCLSWFWNKERVGHVVFTFFVLHSIHCFNQIKSNIKSLPFLDVSFCIFTFCALIQVLE